MYVLCGHRDTPASNWKVRGTWWPDRETAGTRTRWSNAHWCPVDPGCCIPAAMTQKPLSVLEERHCWEKERMDKNRLAKARGIIQRRIVLAYYLHLIWTFSRMFNRLSFCFCICQEYKQQEYSCSRFDCNHFSSSSSMLALVNMLRNNNYSDFLCNFGFFVSISALFDIYLSTPVWILWKV